MAVQLVLRADAPLRNQGVVPDKLRSGEPGTRKARFMAAMTAVQRDPDMIRACARLRDNGKKPIVAITAFMRCISVTASVWVRDARRLS
jgi:hypothetical protein